MLEKGVGKDEAGRGVPVWTEHEKDESQDLAVVFCFGCPLPRRGPMPSRAGGP